MTIIAWDGKSLAADKRASCAGIARTVTKIHRVTYREPGWAKDLEALVAITGVWEVGALILEWWKEGGIPARFPEQAKEDCATLIVITREIRTYTIGPYPLNIEAKQAAFGSGRDFAEAAMHLGKTAREAVEVACHFQAECGNGVDVLEMRR